MNVVRRSKVVESTSTKVTECLQKAIRSIAPTMTLRAGSVRFQMRARDVRKSTELLKHFVSRSFQITFESSFKGLPLRLLLQLYNEVENVIVSTITITAIAIGISSSTIDRSHCMSSPIGFRRNKRYVQKRRHCQRMGIVSFSYVSLLSVHFVLISSPTGGSRVRQRAVPL